MSWQVPILHHLTFQIAPIRENVNCYNIGNFFFFFFNLLVSLKRFDFLKTFTFSLQETKFSPFFTEMAFQKCKSLSS